MNLYIIRALRYILRITVILGIVFAVLHYTDTLNVGGQNLLAALFMSGRGLILISVIVALAFIYPRLSFGEATMEVDPVAQRQQLTDAFRDMKYSLSGEKDGVMRFRSDGVLTRLLASWNDTVRVTPDGGGIRLEGMKKDVARAMLHIQRYTENRD